MKVLADIPGVQVGHAHNPEAATGCTVILTTGGAVCGVDQRGGAPGTRETDLLRPLHLVQQVHAVLLAGGSAFGLAAADGVMQRLEAQGIGFDTGVARVPVVPGAVLFDLAIGRADIRPDAAMGAAAFDAAAGGINNHTQGSVGAGAGATVGKIMGMDACMKAGIGQAVVEVSPELWVGALLAVNAFGDVIDPDSGQILAGAQKLPNGGFADTMRLLPHMSSDFAAAGNTVIGVVATNAALSKEAANKVAQMAHNGLARTIRPAHTMFDGDTLFALATGQGLPTSPTVIGAFAAEAVAVAVINSVKQATSLAGVPAMQGV